MFDHLVWWQVILVLSPIMAVMQVIRYREQEMGQTPFESLTQEQKAWVFLMALPPGLSASLMAQLGEAELQSYIQAGTRIEGSGLRLALPVLNDFLSKLPDPLKGDAPDLVERAAEAVQLEPATALSILRTGLAPLQAPKAAESPPES